MMHWHISPPIDLGIRLNSLQSPIVTDEQMCFCRRLVLKFTGREVVHQEAVNDFTITNTLDNGQSYKISIFLIDDLIARGIK